MRRPSILFLPNKVSVQITNESSILEVALKNKIDLAHSCGGMGTCTTCRVYIESDIKNLPPRNETEAEMADSRGFAEQERLACQVAPTDGLIVRIPEDR
jgi:2Fe-2S ferredoxin